MDTGTFAKRGNVVLRRAKDADLPRLDEITIVCYTPIHESFVAIVGEQCYEAITGSRVEDWESRKTNRIRKTYAEHPDCVWVLQEDEVVFGFVTFALLPDEKRVWIEDNGLTPERRGEGWSTFMLRQLLQYAREQGIRFASVEVDLDDAHIPARHAYQAVGFDRHHLIGIYHQNLEEQNPGSFPVKD